MVSYRERWFANVRLLGRLLGCLAVVVFCSNGTNGEECRGGNHCPVEAHDELRLLSIGGDEEWIGFKEQDARIDIKK